MLLSGKVPGEAKMPRQMEGAPGKQGWGEGDLHTAMQILAPRFSLCSSPIPSFSPFHEDTVQRPLWFLSPRTSAYQAFSAII